MTDRTFNRLLWAALAVVAFAVGSVRGEDHGFQQGYLAAYDVWAHDQSVTGFSPGCFEDEAYTLTDNLDGTATWQCVPLDDIILYGKR